MLVLTVAKGPDRGKVFELRDVSRVIIGRNSQDLKLNDIMISRHHAKLKRDGNRWLLRDLGSRNGTKLNGDRLVQVAILKTGDHILTGYTEFEVSFLPDDAGAPLQAQTPEAPIAIDANAVAEPEDSASLHDVHDEAPVQLEPAARDAAVDLDQTDKPTLHRTAEQAVEPPAARAPVVEVSPEQTEFEDERPTSQVEAVAESPLEDDIEAQSVATATDEAAASHVVAAPVTETTTAPEEVEAAPTAAPAQAQEDEDSETQTAEVATATSSADNPAASNETDDDEVVITASPSTADLQATDVLSTALEAPAAAGMSVSVDTNKNLVERGMLYLSPVDEAVDAAVFVSPLPPEASSKSSDFTPQGEQAASEWMSAIESQLVVVEEQGWDDTVADDDDEFIDAQIEEIEPLADHERSQLYFDEDDHWADDVQLDVDALVTSLEEDGPQALLKDLHDSPASKRAESPKDVVAKIGGKRKKKRR